MANKFWIVEYVDVNAPKAERSEICASRNEARHKMLEREATLHFVELEKFVGAGLCDFIQTAHLFDNVAH